MTERRLSGFVKVLILADLSAPGNGLRHPQLSEVVETTVCAIETIYTFTITLTEMSACAIRIVRHENRLA